MSFHEQEEEKDAEKSKPISFFGLELSNGVVYTILAILSLVFIRQITALLQTLN